MCKPISGQYKVILNILSGSFLMSYRIGGGSGGEGGGYVDDGEYGLNSGIGSLSEPVILDEVTICNIGGLPGTNLEGDLQSSGGSVGQPGFGESMIPVWGAGRSAIDHFQNGNYWRGLGYTALAISDVFLVKSIATGIGRGAWKLGSHSWSATRKWAVKNGYAGAGEPLHHWAITQATAKKYGLEAIANQPWNLTKFGSQVSHMRWAHGTAYPSVGLGAIPGWRFLYPISSTPTWFKATLFSTGGRIID